MATCYRHPSRETGVSCTNCGRPICPDCMTPTPVGMRCPECARQRTRVRRGAGAFGRSDEPRVTYALIIANVVMFIASSAGGGSLFSNGGGSILLRFGLDAPDLDVSHQYYRLITAGFLHVNLLHIAFNMYLLYLLGQMLEREFGSARFAALYVTALLSGSLGALVLSPNSLTVGASGAVFGLMGAAFVEQRSRGIDPFQTGLGALIVINLAFSFVLSGISIGGHIGGLLGGVLVAGAFQLGARRRSLLLSLAGCLLIAAAAVAGSLLAAHAGVPTATGG
jgi:membrane associated rhomboid family serine protease